MGLFSLTPRLATSIQLVLSFDPGLGIIEVFDCSINRINRPFWIHRPKGSGIQVRHTISAVQVDSGVISMTRWLNVDVVPVVVERDRHLLSISIGPVDSIENCLGKIGGVLLKFFKSIVEDSDCSEVAHILSCVGG